MVKSRGRAGGKEQKRGRIPKRKAQTQNKPRQQAASNKHSLPDSKGDEVKPRARSDESHTATHATPVELSQTIDQAGVHTALSQHPNNGDLAHRSHPRRVAAPAPCPTEQKYTENAD
ncbi:hypothetical protein CIHG_08265 [Coccidioides immitis H538.4]|uniref:Uncharacterized protein n=1 Tax=Coccidioides immitis H538.4 TaxID=396776 RepID=A0A0J8RZD2_COCIT|nr:hypothetical protein CIHG_08265 [Coccidioides immitis H538.4]